MERYKQMVSTQGMTPEMFEAQVRGDLSTRQVVQGVQGSAFATTAQTRTALDAFMQKREVQVVKFPASEFLGKVNLSQDELQTYYDKNQTQFQSPETADIEYVVLDLETLRQSMVVSEQELKTYYEQNLQRLASQEERRASHILIIAAKDAPAAEREKARAKVQELLQTVRGKPGSFAEVARKNSQDPGSAAKGGDLDFFPRGAMVKVFEDTAYSMKKSDISDVVESEFGFHIIQLTDIKAPKTQSFEALRPSLEADLKKQQAQRKFAELAEIFSNTVYEQSDSLKPVADKLKLSIQKASQVSRTAMPGAKGVLNHPGLLQSLFSEASVQKQRNTEAIEVAASTLVSARVLKHHPAATLPGAMSLSRDQSQGQAPQVIEAALRADPGALPAWVGVDLGAQGFAVLRVNKVLPREADKKEDAMQAQQQFTQLWASAQAQAYLAQLKHSMKAEILVSKPAPEATKGAAS